MSNATVQLPGILKSIEPALNHYGYFAVTGLVFLEDFGVPVPGESVLIAAAIYAGAGRLNPIAVGVLAVLAAVLGDNIGFAIGRFVGREVILRWGRYVMLSPERLAKGEQFFEHQGRKIIVIARFIEGLRQANGIIAGASEMPWIRFLPYNVAGAVLWVGVWLTLGEVAGNHITTIYNAINGYALYVLVVLGLFLIGLIVRGLLRRRARHQQEALDNLEK